MSKEFGSCLECRDGVCCVGCQYYSGDGDIEDLSLCGPCSVNQPYLLMCPCVYRTDGGSARSGYSVTAGALDSCSLSRLDSVPTVERDIIESLALFREVLNTCPMISRVLREIEEIRLLVHEAHGHDARTPGSDKSTPGGDVGPSWTYVCERYGVKTYYRSSSADTQDILCSGIIESPFLNVAAIINEVQLYHKWVPFIASSSCVCQLSLFRKVVFVEATLPWPLAKRDAVVYGYAVDKLEDGSIYIMCRSQDDESDARLFGYSIPEPNKGTVRMKIHSAGYVICVLLCMICRIEIKLINQNKAFVRVVANIDPVMAYVPYFLVNFITRQVVFMLYSLIRKVCMPADVVVWPMMTIRTGGQSLSGLC